MTPAVALLRSIRAALAGRRPTRGSAAEREVRALVSDWLASRAQADVAAARRVLKEVVGPGGFGPAGKPIVHDPTRDVWAAIDPAAGPLVAIAAPSMEFTIGVVAHTEVPLDDGRLRDLAALGRELANDPEGWDEARAAVAEFLTERRIGLRPD